MKTGTVLIVGCGDLGIRLGLQLGALGWRVAALRRNAARLPAQFEAHAGDYTRPQDLAFLRQLRPELLVTTFTPSERSPAGYHCGFVQGAANLRAALGEYRPRGLIAVSSTRVFAERDGGWVDESSPPARDDPRALAMLEAEEVLAGCADRHCAVRFAGIYGAPEGRLLQRVRSGRVSPARPLRYGNRIHREDCAGFLAHLLLQVDAWSPLYIGADDLPAPLHEVEAWLAAELGITPIEEEPSASTTDTGFVSGHKRCRNDLLRASGYRLRYPDYRSGYRAVLGLPG